MNLIPLESKSDVRETLQAALDEADELDAVLILAIDKQGAQRLRGSTMSGMEKAFLVAFANAWMASWFRLGEGHVPPA